MLQFPAAVSGVAAVSASAPAVVWRGAAPRVIQFVLNLFSMGFPESAPSQQSCSPIASAVFFRSPLKSQIIHRYTRRAFFHDYKAPSMYMLTVSKEESTPRFSYLSGNPHVSVGPDAPRVIHTSVGAIVQEELDKLESFRPDKIKILKSVIMPDHLHVIIRVKEYLKLPVTNYFAMTLSACTSRMRKAGLIGEGSRCFKPGICDSIVSGKGQLEILYRYVSDNPRRLLLKRLHKDLLSRVVGIRIGEYELDAYGNLFLLRLPLLAVHVRRKWTAAEVEEYKDTCLRSALAGYVLISPFIHPVEREIRNESLDAGASVIKLFDRGFGERWKPSGAAFDLCSEGRILYLVETSTPTHKTDLSYTKASHLNLIAEFLASSSSLKMHIKGN